MEKFFVTIKPKDEEFLSPFLLSKFIENNIGPIAFAKNTNEGLLTKLNETQISKIHGASIGNITLEVTRNERMNTSRGVVFCPAFKYITDEDIVSNLNNQSVTEVSRILKKGIARTKEKGTINGRTNTGLFILTFKKPKAPINIKV